MRTLGRLSLDFLIIFLTTTLAVLLRDNFSTTLSRFSSLAPYLLGIVLAALIVLPLSGVSQSIWRFNSPHDHARIFLAMLAIISIALGLGFAVNRLESVPQSLPVIQLVLAYVALAGTRDLLRSYHLKRRSSSATKAVQFGPVNSVPPATIVVIGMSQLLEVYLRLVDLLGGDQVRVAAVLSRSRRHKNRMFRNHRVSGCAEDIEDVLKDLEVRGVVVDRIIIVDQFATLDHRAQSSLTRIQASGRIQVQRLTADLLMAKDTLIHK